MISSANLGEESPVVVVEEIDEEEASGGNGLPDGFGLPVLLEFDEEEILAQLGFGERGGIGGEVGVEESNTTIVGVAGAISVVAQG